MTSSKDLPIGITIGYKGKYRVQICSNGCVRHIGLFTDLNDAIEARQEAEIIYGHQPKEVAINVLTCEGDLIDVYDTIIQAVRDLNMNYSSVSHVLNSRQNSCYSKKLGMRVCVERRTTKSTDP